jgi:[ribosomal protein S5]-alanine N-acetyltransferase
MMQFETISTARLQLRLITESKIAEILKQCPQSEAMQLLGANTDADYNKFVQRSIVGYNTFNRKMQYFQLLLPNTDTVLGECGYHSWAFEHRRAEIFYHIAQEQHKRQGFMTEALNAVLHYGFTAMDLFRIEGVIDIANTASLKLLQQNGFVQEGIMRNHYNVNGVLEDSTLFALLKTEWRGGA